METKKITKEMREDLRKPLPAEAVSPHPSKTYLSTIKAIYVAERLNDVFGVGGWVLGTESIERVDKMVVVKVTMQIPEYGVYLVQFGGNDNMDLGDAYKGATTDGMTKIASYLEIGIDVYKGEKNQPKQTAKPVARTTTTTTTTTGGGKFMNNVQLKDGSLLRTEEKNGRRWFGRLKDGDMNFISEKEYIALLPKPELNDLPF